MRAPTASEPRRETFGRRSCLAVAGLVVGAVLGACSSGSSDREAIEASTTQSRANTVGADVEQSPDGAAEVSPAAEQEIPCAFAATAGALGLAAPLPDGLSGPRCATHDDVVWVVYPPAALADLAFDRSDWENVGGLSIGVGANLTAPDGESVPVTVRGVQGTATRDSLGTTVVYWVDPEFGAAALSSTLAVESVEIFLPLVVRLVAN